jgi:pilus assembly protein Flp/PilA
MTRPWLRFLLDEDGPTAVEYAVVLALIVGMALVGITAFGLSTNATLEDNGTKLQTYMNTGGS